MTVNMSAIVQPPMTPTHALLRNFVVGFGFSLISTSQSHCGRPASSYPPTLGVRPAWARCSVKVSGERTKSEDAIQSSREANTERVADRRQDGHRKRWGRHSCLPAQTRMSAPPCPAETADSKLRASLCLAQAHDSERQGRHALESAVPGGCSPTCPPRRPREPGTIMSHVKRALLRGFTRSLVPATRALALQAWVTVQRDASFQLCILSIRAIRSSLLAGQQDRCACEAGHPEDHANHVILSEQQSGLAEDENGDEDEDGPMDWRETGLKPLDRCRLKGLLIYSPRRLIGKSGKQEDSRFPQQFPDFPLSRFKKEWRGAHKSTRPEGGIPTQGFTGTDRPEALAQFPAGTGLQMPNENDVTVESVMAVSLAPFPFGSRP